MCWRSPPLPNTPVERERCSSIISFCWRVQISPQGLLICLSAPRKSSENEDKKMMNSFLDMESAPSFPGVEKMQLDIQSLLSGAYDKGKGRFAICFHLHFIVTHLRMFQHSIWQLLFDPEYLYRLVSTRMGELAPLLKAQAFPSEGFHVRGNCFV